MKEINITSSELAIVCDILARHVPDREVRAFGSRVIGPTKKFSDLDLVVMGETPIPSSVQGDIQEDFSESDLPFKVDLVNWAETGKTFRKIIERDYVVVQKSRT